MTIHQSFKWTDAAVAALKHLVLKGDSCGTIANELGTSRNSVVGKVRRLNLRMKLSPSSATLVGKITKHTFHPGNLANKKASRALDPLFISPPPAAVTQEYEADCSRLLIHELGSRECRYEVDNPTAGGLYRFCGKETAEGQSWCQHHRKLVFQPRIETLRSKAKAERIARRAE